MSKAAVREEDRADDVQSELREHARIAWSYRVAGNYMDDCRSGEAAAVAYMQYAKVRPHDNGGNLQHVAIYFAEALRDAQNKDELEAIRGKMVGFFSAIDRWVDFAAKNATSESMKASFADIMEKLDDAASGGALRQWEEHMAKVRSDQARVAARARWSKKASV